MPTTDVRSIAPAAMRRLVHLRDAYLITRGVPDGVICATRYRDAVTIIALQVGVDYEDVDAAAEKTGG